MLEEKTPTEWTETVINYRKITELNSLLGNSEKVQIDYHPSWDGDHFNAVTTLLRKAGWNNCPAISECPKSDKETNLTDGHFIVNILVANFMGRFTQASLLTRITNEIH